MKKKQIVNIINFVRGCEPRKEMDLIKPVTEQIRLMKQHGLRGTFLLQYDAMLIPELVELFQHLDREQFELGVWHEIVQPQVELCGLKWRGRFPWDWYTHCGFSVGYTKSERERLADALYEKFKSLFGTYPRVFGSWLFDTHTVRYLSDRYGMDALCNCKEQYGTDGYTLWGGYYGQGYYPSRNNVFMPAQSREEQIPVPLFRMLGSDPVYQFDYRLDPNREATTKQSVISLEPAYPFAGGNPKWIDWFMQENYNGECLSFGYAQAGQENSFGWDAMKDGLTYQFALFERLQSEGKITVETLGETGRWYKATYSDTPASAIVAHTAYDDPKKSSVWYSTKFYRVNLYGEQGNFRIRDLHLFDDKLADLYESSVCTTNHANYDTLPYIDGNRYTGKGVLAGGYIRYCDGRSPSFDTVTFTETGEGEATVTYGDLRIELFDRGLRITGAAPFTLENRIGMDGGHSFQVETCSERVLTLRYHDEVYSLTLSVGHFASEHLLKSEGNILELLLSSDHQ